jgi:ABC-type glycerol-3-phosphate transport system substrate-binding protein
MKRLLISLLVLGTLFVIGLTKERPIFSETRAEYALSSPFDPSASYADYLPDDVVRPERSYVLTAADLLAEESSGYEVRTVFEGETDVILTDDAGSITFVLDDVEAGYYNIRVRYYPIEGKSGSIERAVRINGEIPYDMAEQVEFKRIWVNATNDFATDQNGNEIVPRQIEAPRWIEHTIRDRNGYYQDSLLFAFEDGENTLTLDAVREPMAIAQIEVYQEPALPDYETYRSMFDGATDVGNVMVRVEGEHMHEKTAPTLYPIVDRTSPITTPQHHAKLLLNAGGGINYRLVGDWISYEVEVPTDGFYHLSMRYKQTYLRGAYVTRAIRIDGEIPFAEFRDVTFGYTNWDIQTLGGDDPYAIYLEAGTHTISFEVVLGDFTDSIREIEGVIDRLNEVYRQIIMITSTTPDLYRDYQLDERIPSMLDTFATERDNINAVVDALYESTGENSDKLVALTQIAIQLDGFLERPQTIHQRLAEFRNNVSALGTWILTIKEQPMAIDFIALHGADVELPKANANFFQKVWFEIKSFIASFYVDYNSLSTTESGEAAESITVWVGTGRDQANVLRRLIDESFTPETDIGVNLELVNPGVLLPATFTGKGPDVMLNAGNTTPVNYAMRNAVYDLTQFEDFDEVMSAFQPSAILPYEFEGGVYAMPEQQIFPVMFYRTDIMTEIGIIPEDADEDYWYNFTWDDVIDMIPELQRLNLEFYLPIDIVEQQLGGIIPPNLIYVSLLYQNGGELYSEDETRSLLQERVAVDTFQTWSSFYTNYRFSIQANFVNRFRTGEMPIGISYYNMYNILSVFAPEISGDWTFVPIPGTPQEDGSIDHSTTATGTGAMIMGDTDRPELAWEFLKWWGSEATQVSFGREMEGIMGAAARYPTANVAALEQLPWPSRDIDVLMTQWASVKGIPEIPGSYITGRYLDNSLRRVINTGANPRETLYEYAELINDEITNKRKEFNLD